MPSGRPASFDGTRYSMNPKGARGRGYQVMCRVCEMKDAEIAAVCDVDAAARAYAAGEVKRIGGNEPKQFNDIRDALRDPDIDGVIVATPDHWHVLAGIWTMQAGKALYLEKPIGVTAGEAEVQGVSPATGDVTIPKTILRDRSGEYADVFDVAVPEENEVRLLPQGAIGGSHDSPPNDSILYLINGVPQPKENNKWLDKRSYLDYFKGQHLLVSRVMDYMNVKQRYIEKYGEAAKHGVIEYICVEDTLCDYYMDQHEELKASRRRVSGVVYDENDEPLAHTIIYIWHEKRVWGFETTDSLGNFTFWVPRSDVKMEFTYVGFYKAVVVEPSDTFQTIYLLPNDNLKSLRESLKF